MPDETTVKALAFDVFGTCVDWRGSIARECRHFAPGVDPCDFARRWARKYAGAMRSDAPWRPLGAILADAGRELLDECGVDPDAPGRGRFCDVWRRLDPWPDAAPGLSELKGDYRVVSLSNADLELGRDLARSAGLPWDDIVAPDEIRVYKPDPLVYRNALSRLALGPGEVMMVAAHLFDLEGAKAVGLKTAFVRREGEEPGDPAAAPYVDLIADDFEDLARQLGVGGGLHAW